MEEALSTATVHGYQGRINDLSFPNSSDRHVLATAIHVEARDIIAFNTKDFPAAMLQPWDIAAASPDRFVAGLHDQGSSAIIDVAHTHRASLTRPSKTPDEYLRLLRTSGLTETARRLQNHLKPLSHRLLLRLLVDPPEAHFHDNVGQAGLPLHLGLGSLFLLQLDQRVLVLMEFRGVPHLLPLLSGPLPARLKA